MCQHGHMSTGAEQCDSLWVSEGDMSSCQWRARRPRILTSPSPATEPSDTSMARCEKRCWLSLVCTLQIEGGSVGVRESG